MLTYDVDIWSIRQRKGRPKPFELRWKVGAKPHSRSFKLKVQADGRRSELMAALRDRQQFDEESGLPASELAALNTPTWYEHANTYALMKWPGAAAKQRASIAEGLAVVTPALVTNTRGAPDRKVLRRALYTWAFRGVTDEKDDVVCRLDIESPPADVRSALDWLAKNSLKVTALEEPDRLRPALEALSRKLDGNKAAENTVKRKLMVFSNALRYAVEEKGYLTRNPLLRVDWSPPTTDDEVDFRYVPGPALARRLLEAVKGRGQRGEHLEAFFGCIYYAAMRPGEIASLKDTDCRLPPDTEGSAEEWGELLLEESRPEVGSGWTDDGESYEKRGLKRRARRATRSVPAPPALVRLLREHKRQFGTAPDGRLFRAARGGRIRSTEYCEVWSMARSEVLTAAEVESPLAEVPYSLRHAGVSLWIKAGVDPVEVARRAGHSIAVLYRFYAKILHGAQTRSNQLIDKELSSDDDG
ncbi:site-specific integrase [Streptomyces sp. NPDC088124]|uniref:tyrosine-type recombinase/integrase n=1 Tax=Streptomyces sp. NPDC088124 TaxID=3154654 RepID=UPI003446AA41